MAAHSRVLPDPREWPSLVPQRGSLVWEIAGDARVMGAAGYALLLQVSHPTVGAGVGEHSQFRSDPWGRLFRTLDYTCTMVWGGPDRAGLMGRRIRALHRQIRGLTPDGRRYHALEPEAYAWVHATLAAGILAAHGRFGRSLSGAQREQLWCEWRALGRLIGVRPQDLPEGLAGFERYLAEIVGARLERTEAVDQVLDALAHPAPPALAIAYRALWEITRVPLGHFVWLTTVGLLPPVLRERFGLGWSRAQALELAALARALRAATPLMPPGLRNGGPRYLRWRAEAIEHELRQGPRLAAAAPAGASPQG